MNNEENHVDSFDVNIWSDLLDYGSLFDDVAPPLDPYWSPQPQPQNVGAAFDVSLSGATSQTNECPRKRGRSDTSSGVGTKASRERLRREKLNDRFTELFAVLEPGRPVKTDKLAILGDAIRVLNQLRIESVEYKEMNEKLLEEIKTLKAEKNELREEKSVLKADIGRMEQQLKTITAPATGFVPAHPPIYQAGANKMTMFPGYGYVPMWQYLPQSIRDTSQDHKLRPPAA
ncbi:hypothetical protein RD792_017471 [Penstemon davidsonii]|uniref:BHLH domain-containing protein n=1 Tax=Penstemon davidsonii TaxID=160366 RepID=A0ABR0CM30_9LAMI|nr:hypothetical protein RD792_017471 [Penstemon davidsonii]